MPKTKASRIRQLEDLKEVRAYLARIGATGRSLRTAVIEEQHGSGYWQDKAVIHFTKEGEVKSDDPRFLPTDEEAQRIADEFATVDWPELKLVKTLPKNLPPDLKNASKEDIYEFRDIEGRLIMIQLRKKTKDERGKAYIAWTYWDDDEWRSQEPDGPLPLWGLDKLGDNTTVFLHEGAKAARAMQRLLLDPRELAKHPWGKQLSAAAHLGWIGGALSPHRTDWSALRKNGVSRAYIVSDNDREGNQAVARVSKKLKIVSFHVQFTNEWPASFDMADPWPETFFHDLTITDEKGHKTVKKNYIGPTFRSCLHPATWATEQFRVPVPGSKKPKTVTTLRDCFTSQWAYIEEADVFVHYEFPEILRDQTVFNKMCSSFSDTADTAKLLLQQYAGRRTKLCYRPDIDARVVSSGGTAAINLHVPTEIAAVAGDPTPFLEYMEYLIPNEGQRHEVYRWCATLIARPEVRMEYALLMVGPQGIGKSTLGAAILAPLVGVHNFSSPSESAITDSNFNSWLANKRLAVIHEIYHGHSWKAYNRLKSVITEETVEINKKFEREYSVECFLHVYACSNHEQAIRMDKEDRRWFYPTLAVGPWTKAKYSNLRSWLKAGGLGIVKQWAIDFGEYVRPGDHAPQTARKMDLIEESKDEAEKEAVAVASRIAFEEDGETRKKAPLACTITQVKEFIIRKDTKAYRIATQSIGAALATGGLVPFPDRLKFLGKLETVYLNEEAAKALEGETDLPERNRKVRQWVQAGIPFF